MTERDLLERRGFAPTVPEDLTDPPQFGQITETVKDALVLELRQFFNQPRLNTLDVERRREVPTVRKYAVGFGPGTDPYETVQQIVADWADTGEHLPHAAVTAVTGSNNRLTAGQPFIAHVQQPPRVETGVEPFALGASVAQSWRLTVATAVVGVTLRVTLNEADFTYVVQSGDTTLTAAQGLFVALREASSLFQITRDGASLTVTAREPNTTFVPEVSGLVTLQLQPAGVAPTDTLVFQTTPDRRRQTVVESVTFRPEDFATAAPASSATAADVVRVFNAQARHARADVVDGRVRFSATGGTPNQIEILPATTDNALSAFGLGARGTGVGADAITQATGGVGHGDNLFTLTAPGVGTAATAAVAADVPAFLHLSDAGTNTGRFQVISVTGANAVTYENTAGGGRPASFRGSWFIGHRDDWTNPIRPVMNRRHTSFRLTVSISVLAEDPNTRDELHDLILTQFAYYLELKHYALFGRGWFDEAYPDEFYEISVAQDIAPSGQAQVSRQADNKNQVFEARISIPVTLFDYQDRSVLVPYGPDAGTSFVLRSENITGSASGS